MPTQTVLAWKDGAGWLILSGGNEPTGAVRAAAIEKHTGEQSLAVLSLGADPTVSEAVLNDLQDLGAPTGYVVDLVMEDDETIQKQIAEAGMIVLSSDLPVAEIRSNLLGAAVAGLETAYNSGAVILAESNAATALGAYVPTGEQVLDGLGWLERSYIAPGVTSASQSAVVQKMMSRYPDVVVAGIDIGSALALSGSGLVETLGSKQITLALGSAYTQGEN